ncbi:MAG TPA: hypothetical protein VMR65_07240, partial [Candidatus Sulfotelmatobacter sp.]|nr:hypothetical protein [Candidatus Sulfotelmatobacter sp.]
MSNGKHVSAKVVFIGGGLLVASALVLFFNHYPPDPKDVVGTVGGAQRYHATQITGDDVKVTPSDIATWAQNESFSRIVNDPEARRLFADQAFQHAISDEAVRNVVANDAFRLALRDDAF